MVISLFDKKSINADLALHSPLHNSLLVSDGKAPDLSRYYNNGTITGTTWGIQGRIFDGDDKIDCGTGASLNLTTAFSIGAWVKPTTLVGDTRYVISKGTESTYANFAWRLLVQATGEVALYTSNGVDAMTSSSLSTNQAVVDTWYLVFACFDAAVGGYVYVGTPSADPTEWAKDETVVGAIPDNASMNLTIGARKRATDDEFFIGTIGDTLVYNRRLTLAEVTHICNATKWRYL